MIKKDLNILILEDDLFDAELNKQQLLLLEEYNCNVKVVMNRKAYLEALETTIPDIILSDYNLPNYNGLQALHDLREKNSLIPFIFVTGTMNEEIAADTIKVGAWDYVVKDRLFRLPLAIRSVLKLKEEKETATKAEEKIKRLLTAIEHTSAQIIVMNAAGEIEYINKKFTEVTGLIPENLVGINVLEYFLKEQNKNMISVALETLKKGDVFRGEINTKNKDESERWEIISITPIKNREDKTVNLVAVKEDITMRKKMEQDIIEALNKAERSDKLKDAFLQNLSHEIRTPLNAIVGFSQLLESKENELPEIVRGYAAIIQRSSNQLLSIVSDVLTMASIQTGQETVINKPFDVNKLIDDLFDIYYPLAKQKDLTFTVVKGEPDKKLYIITDETKLTQILTNLIDNALKYTHAGSIEMKYVIIDKMIHFYIKDTGIGIAKDVQKAVFERFRQAEPSIHTKYGGTGLGLSISDSFAQMLNGKITLESELNKGSLFCLSLPFLSFELKTIEKKTEKFSDSRSNYTILVAEDEINNYLLIEAYLQKQNIKIIHAYNGLEAVNFCKANDKIDLILMDIKMPIMDGIEAFKEIRKFRTELPIIAQTAYVLEKERQKIVEVGFNGYLPKPIKKEELLKAIEVCLSQNKN